MEFYYKNDALGDPLISDEHVRLMKLAEPKIVEEIKQQARKINAVLQPFFKERKMLLVDFKLEFGLHDGKLMLADEISPDTCRFWIRGRRSRWIRIGFGRTWGRLKRRIRKCCDGYAAK